MIRLARLILIGLNATTFNDIYKLPFDFDTPCKMYLNEPRTLQSWTEDNLQLSTSCQNVARYTDQLFHQLYGLYLDPELGGPSGTIDKILALDEYNPIAHSIKAKFIGDSSSILPQSVIHATAKELDSILCELPNRKFSVWETLHVKAAKAYVLEDYTLAISTWQDILIRHPKDILSQMNLFINLIHCGRPYEMYDLTFAGSRALKDSPYEALANCRQAFALEQMGQLHAAEKMCYDSYNSLPWNPWAGHTMAHVYESWAKPEKGIAFYKEAPPKGLSSAKSNIAFWGENFNLSCHQFWHYCLFCIETGQIEEAFRVYDDEILARVKHEKDNRFMLSDAIGFLLRMEFMKCAPNCYLREEMESRWRDLLEIILSSPELRAFSNFPFYDNIIWLGLCAAGSKVRPTSDGALCNKFESVKQKFKRYIQKGLEKSKEHFNWNSYTKENHLRLTQRVIEASEAFAENDCIAIVDTLYPVHNELNQIGGSRAQADVFLQLLCFGLAGSKRAHDLERLHMLCRQRDVSIDSKSHLTKFMEAQVLIQNGSISC